MSEETQNVTEETCGFDFENLPEQLDDVINCKDLTDGFQCLNEAKEKYDSLILELIGGDQNVNLEIIEYLYATYDNSFRQGFEDTNQAELSLGFDLFSTSITSIDFYDNLPEKEFDTLDDLFSLSKNFYTALKGTTEGTFLGLTAQDVSVSDGNDRVSEYSIKRWKTFLSLTGYAGNGLNDPNLNQPEFQNGLEEIKRIANELMFLVNPYNSEPSECAKKIALVEEELVNYSAQNLGLATTARGDFTGIGIADRLNLLEILAVAAPGTEAPAGSNVGIRFTGGLQDLKEQCIFLSQIFHLVDHHKKEELKRAVQGTVIYPYAGSREESNASLTIEGEPFGFINQLTQYPTTANFFDATNAQLAHLQPMMRFFKITPSNSTDGSVEESYEFKFDTFASQQDIQEVFTNRNKRGFGAGIKSFNFTYDGSNPFSIKKSIKATLTIYANNFSELIRQRGNIRYIDLALKTGTAIRERTGDPELDFRIKAVVGLAVPNGNTTANFSDIMAADKDVKNKMMHRN
jgi:hypothetical protein